MTAQQHHAACVAAGLLGLVALACLLWPDDPVPLADEEPSPMHKLEPVDVGGRVATFDNGRTTIPPKIGAGALARLRAMRWPSA